MYVNIDVEVCVIYDTMPFPKASGIGCIGPTYSEPRGVWVISHDSSLGLGLVAPITPSPPNLEHSLTGC